MIEENPYKPTDATLRDPPPPPRSPVLAILAGLGTDIGGTMLSSIVIAIVYTIMLAAEGRNPEQIVEEVTAATTGAGYFIVVSTIMGGVFSVLGGYICARIVRRDEHRFGAILAALSMVIGLVLGGVRSGAGLNSLLLVLTFASVMAGAELGRRRNLADVRKAGLATAA